MATSKVSPDSDEIVSEIHIAAPPDRVFQALVDPGQVVKWWGQSGVYRARDLMPTCAKEENGAALAWGRMAAGS